MPSASRSDDRTDEPTSRSLLAPHELGAWKGMLEVHAAVTHQLDRELRDAHDLPLSSYEVLMYLGDAGEEGLRMAALADQLLLSRSGLTRIVDRLEKLDLVARRPCEDDGRGLIAALTATGRSKLDQARPTHMEGIRRHFLSKIDRADMDALAEIWERLGSK